MKRELKDAANAVEDASNSRALVIAARVGFAVSGLLHLLVGFVAIQLALGQAGQAGPADQAGAVAQLAAQPQGLLLLWAGFAASASGNSQTSGQSTSDFTVSIIKAPGGPPAWTAG
jgi:hypothetical protein